MLLGLFDRGDQDVSDVLIPQIQHGRDFRPRLALAVQLPDRLRLVAGLVDELDPVEALRDLHFGFCHVALV